MMFTAATIARLEKRRPFILAELHPLLRKVVVSVLDDLGGRLTPWCGFRGQQEQVAALAAGTSHARWGESPHNFSPALACDLVLNPERVPVRANPVDPRYPDLWDDETPEALAAWEALEVMARMNDLERVKVKGRRDRPHVQLPGWRRYVVV